jgi:methyltransferase (TIGR00027 family)
MQVRTFALDEEVIRFAQSGGRQLVLLGAGLDARALRLRRLGLRVFEVDHPATQARKRQLLGDAATFVAWDFEHDPLRLLPEHLCNLGYQREERSCVVWEGVSMYLSEAANEETFAMLESLLVTDSVVAFTYFSREQLQIATVASGSFSELLHGGASPGLLVSNRICSLRGLLCGDSLSSTTTPPGCWRRDGCRRTSPRSSRAISGE